MPGARRRTLLSAAVAGLLPLAGCASSGTLPPSGGDVRRIPHRWGEALVPGSVDRVVAIGPSDMEAVIALGVTPVGGSDVFGLDGAVRPWVAAALAGRAPTLLDWRDPPFEAIAALRPDVIFYVNAPDDERIYELLSRIAPTVGAPPGSTGSFGVPWRDQLRLIGEALGRGGTAARLVASVEAAVGTARSGHPELRDVRTKGGLVINDTVYLWPSFDPRVRLLRELGLRVDEQPTPMAGSGSGYLTPVSPERYDLLESEVLYLGCTDAQGRVDPALRASPTFDALDVVRRGGVIYAPGPASIGSTGPEGNYASAFGIGGPLGIPACLPRLVDDFTQALQRQV